jgi:hypothetical protein
MGCPRLIFLLPALTDSGESNFLVFQIEIVRDSARIKNKLMGFMVYF